MIVIQRCFYEREKKERQTANLFSYIYIQWTGKVFFVLHPERSKISKVKRSSSVPQDSLKNTMRFKWICFVDEKLLRSQGFQIVNNWWYRTLILAYHAICYSIEWMNFRFDNLWDIMFIQCLLVVSGYLQADEFHIARRERELSVHFTFRIS